MHKLPDVLGQVYESALPIPVGAGYVRAGGVVVAVTAEMDGIGRCQYVSQVEALGYQGLGCSCGG